MKEPSSINKSNLDRLQHDIPGPLPPKTYDPRIHVPKPSEGPEIY